ncbi:MAG: family 16 glycosylhydrolase, partial [Flavobacteriaceae bacterium]|nr:family 16 glycosylhydrolase [Flavobacteriaceae bacterium]
PTAYCVAIPAYSAGANQTFSSFIMYVNERDQGVTLTDFAIETYDSADTTAPVITVAGDAQVTLDVGATYTDAGATAVDDRDGTITVVTTGANVDTSTPGTYTVTYTVGDLAGNQAQATRTVTVQAAGPLFTGAFANATKVGDVYTFPSGADAWAGFANDNADLYPISLTYGGRITFTGSAAQDTSIRFLFENAPHPNNTPNHATGNVTITTSNPTAYSVAIPAYTAGANQTFSSFIMYVNERDQGVTLTDFQITTYQSQQEADDALAARLIYSDEFNVAGSLDDSKWYHQVEPILDNGTNWANGELQHYTARAENSFVSEGTLKIVAKKEDYTYNNATKNYTSARLNSKFVFKYGRVDVRAKAPAGGGTWPAIWTLGANINETGNYHGDQYGSVGWPHCGEIDIMEQYGDDKTKTLSTLHWQNSETDQYQYEGDETPISNVGTDFHVYRVDWSESKIEFYLDGVKFYEKANTSSDPFNNEHYLLLNLAIGGSMGGTVPENFTDQTLEIDYVRVYSQ